MKIIEQHRESEEELTHYIERQLDGHDYERGELETMSATIDNQQQAIGNLIELLAEKDILNLDEVRMIVGGYEPITRVVKPSSLFNK